MKTTAETGNANRDKKEIDNHEIVMKLVTLRDRTAIKTFSMWMRNSLHLKIAIREPLQELLDLDENCSRTRQCFHLSCCGKASYPRTLVLFILMTVEYPLPHWVHIKLRQAYACTSFRLFPVVAAKLQFAGYELHAPIHSTALDMFIQKLSFKRQRRKGT
ncbi:hypothetical protein CBL_01621 [Carabus blaptoides fortunei]